MTPFCPGHIIDEIVHRDIGQDRGRESNHVAQSTQAIEWLIIQSCVPESLPDEGITEVVDKSVTEQCRVAPRDALTVIG